MDALVYKISFFLSLLMICYVYVGYPLCVWILTRWVKKKIDKAPYEPNVTIIIAAYNEKGHINKTIANKLQQDYPEDRLEIIVVSDGSTDHTDEIVRSFQDRNVRLLRQSRAGKTTALNIAVPYATGEILVFSDANSMYAADAVKHLVANFHDPQVGYVTGKMIYINSDDTTIGDGCSAYMKYENTLRHLETQISSIVGVDGGIDAMRKSLYSTLKPGQLPDFVQPLKVIEKGYRVVYDPEALLKEHSLSKSDDEYRMRVRVTLRAFNALRDMPQLLWGGSGLLIAWEIWSHKVLRYLCFIFLMVAYLANLLLLGESIFYQISFTLQTACYLGAFLSLILEKNNRRFYMLYFLHYFVILNVAAAHAAIKFIMGEKLILWTPRKG